MADDVLRSGVGCITDLMVKEGLINLDFADVRTLFFPQPIYPTGWWSATLGSKDGKLDRFREQDAANAGFETHYYNAQIHRAAFAQPEFFRRLRDTWLAAARA